MKKAILVTLSAVVALLIGLVVSTCGDGGEEQNPCCPEAAEGQYWVDVNGTVKNLQTQLGVAVALAPISPLAALSPGDPPHLAETTSAANGSFATDCFDVTEVALGLVVLADDESFDGDQGDYLPTVTGVRGWDTNAEKVCTEGATVFALPNTMAAGLDQLPGINVANDGFAMGIVVDANGTPVPGAVVKKADGTDLAQVYYPNADFSDFSGTETSVNGAFILPAGNFSGILAFNAFKQGMTFDQALGGVKAGYCYFVFIQEASAS